MSFPVKKYIKEAKKRGHSKEYIVEIKSYVKKLQENNLPVIFSIVDLANCFEITPTELLKIAEYSNFFNIKNKKKYDAIPDFLLSEINTTKRKTFIDKICFWFTEKTRNIKCKSYFKKNNNTKPQQIDFIDELLKPELLLNSSNEELPREKYYYKPGEYDIINSNYKFFTIKKRNGGVREIMAPKNKLKNIQRWINFYILSKIELNESSYGFIKARSIKNNAQVHSNQDCILNIDLLKFFDNITQKRVYGMFKEFGYHPNLARLLASLTTAKHKKWYWKDVDLEKYPQLKKLVKEKPKVLPQGAPTSPSISNIICRKLDSRLNNLAKKCNCKYSRYADDLTFSGKKENLPSLKLIRKIIESEGFFINNNKIGKYSRGSKQYVTGLSINDGVRVPRAKKREIRKILFFCKKYGVKKHLENTGSQNKKHFKEWLSGNISFINDIEPDKAKKYWNIFNELDW